MEFLRTHGQKIVDEKGKPVMLRGVNFGGWLMMEAYFMYSAAFPVKHFKQKFRKALGLRALRDFEKSFRDHYIRKSDVALVKKWGFNCIRVPFHYGLIEHKPYLYHPKGIAYLDCVIRWAKEYKIRLILDLHAAPGSQNNDWHSDSYGKAELWTKKSYRHRVYALWEFLADRYKNEPAIAGYDILNEAVLKDTRRLNSFYKEAVKAIRSADRKHILFVEGNNWAQDLTCLHPIEDDNHVLSIHNYVPLEFVFNLRPGLKYPLKGNIKWNRAATEKLLKPYAVLAKKRNVPVYVGEFGVNFRDEYYGEVKWLKDVLSCFKQFGFHWTYWTYKAVKNGCFPDGLCSYYEDPPWVNRAGPLSGWDTYHLHWRKHKQQMCRSWHTDQFAVNRPILKALQHAVA